MADITQEAETGGDQHYCTSCGNWFTGYSVDEKVVHIEYLEDYTVPVDEFKVEDFTKTRRQCAGGCTVVLDAGWDGDIIDVTNGDIVYTCTECDSVYPEEDMARNCC